MQQVGLLRELVMVKVEIVDLGQHLSGATDGLWNGLSTRTDAMAAAIAFQQERRNITDKGALEETHDRVGAGGCAEPNFRSSTSCLPSGLRLSRH